MEPTTLSVIGLVLAMVAVVAVLLNQSTSEVTPDVVETPKKDTETSPADLVALADRIEPVMEKLSHPTDILTNRHFEKAVSALASDQYTVRQCWHYAMGANWILSCVGYEALARRNDSMEVVDKAFSGIANAYAWPLFFLLRFIDARSTSPIVGRFVCSAQDWWSNNTVITEAVGAVFSKRLEAGEEIVFGAGFSELRESAREGVRNFVATLPEPACATIGQRLAQYEGQAIDRKFLRTIGELLAADELRDPVFDTEQIVRLGKEMFAELDLARPRSILVVGPSGVGKSALRRAFARGLLAAGWQVFRTSAPNIIADKMYVGQIEGQLRKLVRNATAEKRVAIYVDRMSDLSEFGATKNNANSVLDQLWPKIESHQVFLVSETSATGLQRLLRKYPSLPAIMKVMHMEPASEAEARVMAGELLDYMHDGVRVAEESEVISETLQLSQQYLSHKSMPGNVLTLLELAVFRARREGDDTVLQRDHVLNALSQISGLPREVLDDKQQLDIAAVASAFRDNVIGQDEAVDCLVERIAMLKAGLTDPTRPVGVFLFAGPTGTGKTEIAKTLADILFGSPEQMIRLDMSEYQDADSVWRILGQNSQEVSNDSLVSKIRERPFSVVLLDEFEKAHAKVWDVFLQVFDDGRLSDTQGRVADFRHAIIILTSNLGAKISNEAGIGFTGTMGGFSSSDVMRTVNRTFRREFINRLDRVVVFNPLNRETMRAILHKELSKALGRRGIRTKQWAVEWEDSAIEFLLGEGFTPDLGARPLRRAIEQHLLAPLSLTMVQNRAPAGEQFLFIRSNGAALQVEFIDPDADPDSDDDEKRPPVTGLSDLIMSFKVSPDAAGFLGGEIAAVLDRTESDGWAEDKAGYLSDLNDDGFWDRKDRFTVLDRIELIDRLDSAASALATVTDRLEQNPGDVRLTKSTANRLYVLQEGLKDLDQERPTQAYLGIRLVSADAELTGATRFLKSLTDMYRNWAGARGMRLHEIDASGSRYDVLFVVSGFGSFGILEPESGLHVFEVPKQKAGFDRIRVRVQVAPVPAAAIEKRMSRNAIASKALDAAAPQKVDIVRRWREQPSPLVRDSVRGWRTGRIDRVISGNFDVLV